MEIYQCRCLTHRVNEAIRGSRVYSGRRIQLHVPIAEDIEMLNSRVGAPLECPDSIPIIVRHHKLCDVLNKEKPQEASQISNVPITHYLINIMKRYRMS